MDTGGPRARTRHAELSLDQVAEALPGTGELMRSVGYCYGMCWHAAEGGNRDLALYFLRRTRSLLRGLAVTRPRYAEQCREFDRDHLEPTYLALEASDLSGFRAAYDSATARANLYHEETGHPYIRWRRPAETPDSSFDLG